jgi:hypothetical protein
METVAPGPPPAPPDVVAAAPVAPRVVNYETPAGDPYSVRIRHAEDGALTVTLPSTPDEQVQCIVKHLVLLAILGTIGAALLERLVLLGAGPLSIGGGAVLAFVAAAVARSLVRYVARRREPTVIAVDGEYVHLNRPAGLRKQRRWPRRQVVNVRDGTFNRPSAQFAELVLAGGISVPIAVGRAEWERRRVIAALRETLAMCG